MTVEFGLKQPVSLGKTLTCAWKQVFLEPARLTDEVSGAAFTVLVMGVKVRKDTKQPVGAERGQHCPHVPGCRLTVKSKQLHQEESKGQSHAGRQAGSRRGGAESTGDC